jgi:predicted acylesterase/phospholipase RssA
MQNIRKIYACSAGAMCAIFFCLVRHHRAADTPPPPESACTWAAVADYIIGRPWEDIFTIDASRIITAFGTRGLFDRGTLETVFASFFEVLDIPLNITLADFYTKVAPIELHFFTFELHSFRLVDLSRVTHPDLPLFEALHMTCSLPIFMTPVLRTATAEVATTPATPTHECYMDGGVITNYPLRQCIAAGTDPATILGIKNMYDTADKSTRVVSPTSSLFDYFTAFVFRMIDRIKDPDDASIPYEIRSPTEYMNIHNVTLAVGSKIMRRNMWEFGTNVGRTWLAKQSHAGR